MEFNQNRLRFVHCEHLFNNAQEIKDYVRSVQFERASLYAEPMIFKYGTEKEPCIVLAIGSVGEGEFIYDSKTGEVLNETYYIDFSQVERDIVELYKQVGENRDEINRIDGIIKNMIEACGFDEDGKYIKQEGDKILQTATSLQVADKMLSDYILALEKRHELHVKDTNSLDLSVEKNDSGTTIHGDVKRGTKIYEGRVIENIIVEQEDGIFTNVDLDYFEKESKLTLTINGDKKKDIPLPVESHVIKGEYDPYTEMLILTLNNSVNIDGELKDKVEISMAKLIDEWEVLGESSDTPIILTKEHVKSNDTEHDNMYEWQDILKADVRILDNQIMPENILKKDSSGKFLYVDGSAENITYLRNGEKINAQQGLDEKISKSDISKYNENTISLKEDGLFSYIDFSYDNGSNKIIFKRTNPKGEVLTQEYILNSFSFIEGIEYDPMSEEIIITYKDANNEVHKLRIPLQLIISQLEVENSDTTVTLTLIKNPQGIDKLKADVNISPENSNILEDVGHALLVRGTADNIKMIDKVLGNNVEEAIQKITTDNLSNFNKEKNEREESDRTLQANIDSETLRAKDSENQLQSNIEAEERRATNAEEKLNAKIEKEIEVSRENEKMNYDSIEAEKLRATNEESRIEEKLDSEIYRSTNKDNEIELSLNEEIVRAKTSEHDIKVDLINEAERATLTEKDINDRLISEIERSKTTDSEISTALSEESNRAKKAEGDLNLALTNEIDRAKLAEQSLKDSIVSETNRAQGVEHTLEDKILAEKTRAENVENTIIRNLNDEVSRASRVEETLRNDLTDEINRATTAENTINEKVDAEIKRSSDADEALSERLIHTAQDLSFITRDSGTVTLIKTTENVGSSITAEVNISNKENNILNKNGEPLYASVDIEYNSAENKLILKRSGNVDKEIKLNEGSIINSIVYDQETKQLIITYFDAYGNERVETVNVTDLFNQWVVETNHLGAVLLSKENNYDGKGTDKLIAEVVISELPSNILVNDKGSLYVSNSGENIILNGGEHLTDAIDSLRNKDIELNKAILNEVNRASNAEHSLSDSILTEERRAVAAETEIQTNIDSEVLRATSAEQVLASNINNNSVNLKTETEQRIAEDNYLRELIVSETLRANEADNALKDSITEETTRAVNAEADLASQIATEKVRAETAETAIEKELASVKNSVSNNTTALDSLMSDVEEVVKTYAMSVEDTATVDLTKKPIDAGGFIVSADLKISSRENNQIIKFDDGIFSNVNLTYSNNNNTLHFSTNGNTVDIPLTSVSTIEKITYDAENNEIVISYISNGELKETRFSANSLFKPVVTNNDGNNVIVESNTNVDGASELSANLYFKDNIDNEATTVTLKATEDNKLKASVNVGGSASVRNILEITDDGNSLFVNGQATNIDMVNKQLGSGTENDPHIQVDNVETAIHSLDDRIDVLRRELEGYLGDDLINSIVKDINNLKFKTNIVAKDTPSVDLTFESSETSSSMKADVVMSQDPHNLLTVFDDEWPHDGDGYGVFNDGTYNGVLFDGNIDYLTFQHKDILSGNTDHWSDWTRHLQLKRDDVIFENRSEALEFLNNAEFLNDKKDGEPLLARYKDVDGVRVILAFVRVENNVKTVQTIDSKGTTIDELTYCPDDITKIATDAYGIQTTTIVPAECLYLEYTDSASIKHTLVVPLKDLIEEYSYPDAIDTYDGQKGTSDGESVKTFHNVKFDVERHENGKSIIKADIEYFDCGWY